MGFDDYFENKRTYRKFDNFQERDHHSVHQYSPGYGGGRGMEHYGFYLVSKIWRNRKLRLLFILASLLLVIALIFLLITLIPFIIRIVDSIAQTGLKGITESVTAFIEKLWSGSGS
jgi:uncharacterized membrane protein